MGSLYSKRICKFGSILLGHFIKHKPLFLESSPLTQIQESIGHLKKYEHFFFINGITFPKQLMSNFSPKIHFSWFLNIKLCEKYICPINSLTWYLRKVIFSHFFRNRDVLMRIWVLIGALGPWKFLKFFEFQGQKTLLRLMVRRQVSLQSRVMIHVLLSNSSVEKWKRKTSELLEKNISWNQI